MRMVIQAPDAERLNAAFDRLDLRNDDDSLRDSGLFADGTGWQMAVQWAQPDLDNQIGTETNAMGDTVPVYSILPPSVYLYWNGAQAQNPFWQIVEPFGLTVWWHDDESENAGPRVIKTLPEWFPVIG